MRLMTAFYGMCSHNESEREGEKEREGTTLLAHCIQYLLVYFMIPFDMYLKENFTFIGLTSANKKTKKKENCRR